MPHALALLAQLHQMIDDALAAGALSDRSEVGEVSEQQTLRRTLRWVGGLNGALLVSNATSNPAWLSEDELDGQRLAIALAQDMLLGWGAPPLTLASANEFVRNLAARDRLLPQVERVLPGTDGADDGAGPDGIVLD